MIGDGCGLCRHRLKREEARIAKEIEEREQEEARKMLEAAQKKIGTKRLNIADGATLDKATLMNQVRPFGISLPLRVSVSMDCGEG